MSPADRKRVRLITFDVGGTLIHPHPSVGAVYAAVLNRRGFAAPPEKVGQAFDEAWEEAESRKAPGEERYRTSIGGERGYWRRVLESTVRRLGGTRAPKGAAEELFEVFGHRDTWRVYAEVEEVLDELASRGMRLGIVSNWDSRLPTLLKELGLHHRFGEILVSALEGCEKPDPRIFRRAASRAGVRTAGMLHVGDRVRDDQQGARAAGCHALLVERHGAGRGDGLRRVLEWAEREPS